MNPTINGYCGDLARTYYIERGVARHTPQHEKEFISGAHAQNQLHTLLKQVAHPNMSFHELYQIMYKEINSLGFEMLDYLGHNVQKDIQHLDFISANVACLLGDVGFFTLEPRIRLKMASMDLNTKIYITSKTIDWKSSRHHFSQQKMSATLRQGYYMKLIKSMNRVDSTTFVYEPILLLQAD